MNIFFIVTGLGMGGAERQVCDLADALANGGHKVTVVALTGNIETAPAAAEVEIIALRMQKTLSGFLQAMSKLRKIVLEKQPDAVHAHMFHANIMARLLRLSGAKIPRLICTAHNTNEGGKVRMLAYRLTNFLSDFNTNVSQEAVDAFVAKKAFRQGQLLAMPNGIDTDKFKKILTQSDINALRNTLGITAQHFCFIAIGRLHEAKDYPNLLAAFHALVQQQPHARLLIVGAGSLECELKQLCSTLGLQAHCQFLGLRTDIAALLNAADAFVLSSRYEGFGLVVAEAMACEKPVVATDCGGVKEVTGGNGFLVPPQNPHALAQAMQQCMELTSDARLQMGTASRKHIESSFSLKSVAAQWLKIYQCPRSL